MTCVYKEYEVKIKMAAAKSEVFIGFTIKLLFVGGINLWWLESFPDGGRYGQIFD